MSIPWKGSCAGNTLRLCSLVLNLCHEKEGRTYCGTSNSQNYIYIKQFQNTVHSLHPSNRHTHTCTLTVRCYLCFRLPTQIHQHPSCPHHFSVDIKPNLTLQMSNCCLWKWCGWESREKQCRRNRAECWKRYRIKWNSMRLMINEN